VNGPECDSGYLMIRTEAVNTRKGNRREARQRVWVKQAAGSKETGKEVPMSVRVSTWVRCVNHAGDGGQQVMTFASHGAGTIPDLGK